MSGPKRVLVVQPSLQPPGGGNAVAAWMIQALVDHHDVSVLTWRDALLFALLFARTLTAQCELVLKRAPWAEFVSVR